MHRTHTPKNADQVARKAPSVEEVRRLLARYRRSTVTQTPSRSSQLRRPPTRRV